MMKRIVTLTIMLALLLCAAVLAEVSGDYTYEVLADNTVRITKYKGTAAVLDIPVELDGLTVTEIEGYAFSENSTLKSVIIPEGITSIGEHAFLWCTSLTAVTVPDSVTSIGKNAFLVKSKLSEIRVPSLEKWLGYENSYLYLGERMGRLCIDGQQVSDVEIPDGTTVIRDWAFACCESLTSITIPDSVTTIGRFAFKYCTGLSSITIPDSVTSIGIATFSNCQNLVSVSLPDSITSISGSMFIGCSSLADITIPGSVTEIEGSAFNGCSSLTDVVIPDSVTSIGDYAFRSCSNSRIIIPDSVTSIGEGAFDEGGILYVTELSPVKDELQQAYPDRVVVSAYSGDFTYEEGQGGTCTITGYNGDAGSLTIPEELNGLYVNVIGYAAFMDCSSLTEVVIPDSISAIGDNAFKGCSGLTGITIPDSVRTIGRGAFEGCSSLASVAIPYRVRRIDGNPFVNCTSLKTISVSEDNQYFEIIDGVLYHSLSNMLVAYPSARESSSLVIPGGISGITAYAFKGCVNSVDITIPESITEIADHAFDGCSGLRSISIPGSVTTIGEYAFMGCSGLKSVTIPDSVTAIGYCAFRGCDSLESMTLPFVGQNRVNTYSSLSSLFGTDRNIPSTLTTVVLSSACTGIPAGAFLNFKNLTSIVIPDSVTSIGTGAFGGCESLTGITIPSGVQQINGNPFSACVLLGTIDVSAGNQVFESADGVLINRQTNTLAAYPAGKEDASYAIPEGIVCIGKAAFENCGKLTGVTIPDSVTSIEYAAFNSCSRLSAITIPDSVTSIGTYVFYECSSLTCITVSCNSPVKAALAEEYPDLIKPAHTVTETAGVPANCTYPGSSKHWVCGYCGQILNAEGEETDESSLIIPPVINVHHLNGSACRDCGTVFSEGEADVFTLPAGTAAIRVQALYGIGARVIIVPDSCTVVESEAFAHCENLELVFLPAALEAKMPEDAFTGSDSVQILYR